MLDFDAIISEASQLSVADRLRLIDQLAASVPDDQPPSLAEPWMAEIDRRSNEIDSGAVTTEPWDSIRSRLFRQHGVSISVSDCVPKRWRQDLRCRGSAREEASKLLEGACVIHNLPHLLQLDYYHR